MPTRFQARRKYDTHRRIDKRPDISVVVCQNFDRPAACAGGFPPHLSDSTHDYSNDRFVGRSDATKRQKWNSVADWRDGTKAMLKNPNAKLVPCPSEARRWTQILARYGAPSPTRSIIELVITVGPLVLLWFLMWATLDLGYWVGLLFAVPAAGFLVRLFMIQHDCGHGAFLHHRLANDWVGRVIGVLTLTPYDFWRRTHAIHHATSGNLDRRGIGDIDTLTVHEYLGLSQWGRLRYRVYRHPIIMFGLGPAFLFIVQHRLPFGLMRAGWQPWLTTMATNVAIAAR